MPRPNNVLCVSVFSILSVLERADCSIGTAAMPCNNGNNETEVHQLRHQRSAGGGAATCTGGRRCRKGLGVVHYGERTIANGIFDHSRFFF